MSKCNGDCFNCVFDDCILEYGESVPKEKKEPDSTRQSYYARHRAERIAYQIAYGRKKYGYKPKVEKTKEEILERKRRTAREYYKNNREKCIEYNREYYQKHREYYLQKSRERYKRICEERRTTE